MAEPNWTDQDLEDLVWPSDGEVVDDEAGLDAGSVIQPEGNNLDDCTANHGNRVLHEISRAGAFVGVVRGSTAHAAALLLCDRYAKSP